MSSFSTHQTILSDAISTIVATRRHLPLSEVNDIVCNFCRDYISKNIVGCKDKRLFRKVWNRLVPNIVNEVSHDNV